MLNLENFEQYYYSSMVRILQALRDETKPELAALVRSLLDTDPTHAQILPASHATAFTSAQAFCKLVDDLHHATYDDGEVTFFISQGRPSFCFGTAEASQLATVLPCDAWIVILKTYCHELLLKGFKSAAARHGIEFARKNYKERHGFDPAWTTNPEILAEIAAQKQRLTQAGIL